MRSDILYAKKEGKVNKGPFVGHLGFIWALAKMGDNMILSGGRDKEIKVWSRSGNLKHSLGGHQSSVLCIEKMSRDIFISGSRERQIIVWKNLETITKMEIHSAIILSLCRLDDEVFASSSGDHTVKISTIDGTLLRTFEEHSNWVWQVVKLDDNHLASSSEDGTIKIWNRSTDKSIRTFFEDHPIMSLAFNKQERKLFSGNLKGELSIHTLTKDFQQSEIKIFQAHHGIIRTIKIIDGNHIATGGEDNEVKIWRLDGQLIAVFYHQNFVQSIEVLDSRTLISASYDGTIKTWKIERTT